MDALATAGTSTWTNRRRRAEELLERHRFATEVLGLYVALLPVQERAAALEPGVDLLEWGAGTLLPAVVEVTLAAAPARLAAAAQAPRSRAGAVGILADWLRGADQTPVDRYLARATLGPVLEARPELASLCSGDRDGGQCPWCGAPPQLSWSTASGDPLVSPPRRLCCSRCQRSWMAARTRCPGCGEAAASRLRVFAEETPAGVLKPGYGAAAAAPPPDSSAILPQLRIEACESCHGYLLNVDLGRDPRAVPEVDELAGLPLCLYAEERGYRKITPNLMGM
jgi:Protein involved in formate dehydrogenase formation